MRILVLGSSGSNIDLMEYCFKAGLEVHCISLKSNHFADAYAHYFVAHDYSSEAFVEDYCVKNDIQLIYSMGSDICMQISAIVSQRLKLPSLISPETARLCADKILRRTALGAASPYNVEHKLIDGFDELSHWNTFPCIIKPVDGQGQKGVFKATSRMELQKLYAQCLGFSASGRVIVEEYISGRESTVNCFMQNSSIYFFAVYDKMPTRIKNNWSPQQYRLPSFYKNDRHIIDLIHQISKSAQIHDGPLMIQIRYRQEIPKVIEYFSRPGGSHTYAFIEKYYGVNLNETLIRHLKGESLPEPRITIKHPKLTYHLVYGPSGQAPRYDFKNLKDVKEHKTYFAAGELVPGKSKYERIGYYIQ